MFLTLAAVACVASSLLSVVLMAINRDAVALVVVASILSLASVGIMMAFVVYTWRRLFDVHAKAALLGVAAFRPYVLLLFMVVLLFGTASGAFVFWILDPDPSRASQWEDINNVSAWRVFVRSVFLSTLIFGTGGTTQFSPLSVGAQLYATFLIYLNIASVATVFGVVVSVLYENKSKAKEEARKKNDDTRPASIPLFPFRPPLRDVMEYNLFE